MISELHSRSIRGISGASRRKDGRDATLLCPISTRIVPDRRPGDRTLGLVVLPERKDDAEDDEDEH
jgi:hypothetical protein